MISRTVCESFCFLFLGLWLLANRKGWAAVLYCLLPRPVFFNFGRLCSFRRLYEAVPGVKVVRKS